MSDGFPGITKPCPFCGRRPKRNSRASTETDTGMVYFVVCYCGGCVARAWTMGKSIDEVLTLWNTRAEVT